MSLSDGGIQPTMNVSPSGSSGGWGGFGGDGGWWFIILFLALFCGWGGNGFGNNRGNSGGVVDGYVLASDFANLLTGFGNAELSRCNQQAALMQQLNNMAMQAQECCCENRAAVAQVRYDMASQACDTRNTVQNSTRDIIDAMNCGFRSIDQRLTAQELSAKDAKIAEQNQQLIMANLAASQATQTNEIRDYVYGQFVHYNPRPVPAFEVPAPYQYSGCNNGYNYGCRNCA